MRQTTGIVLIVEDNRSLAETLGNYLESQGFDVDYAADGLCILSNLARSTLSREGDQVITTGLGGVFPPDVLVGVIKELTPEASGKSTLAVIQPGADPRTVRHVFIITNY